MLKFICAPCKAAKTGHMESILNMLLKGIASAIKALWDGMCSYFPQNKILEK